jgi:hypothetical protein
MDDCLTNIILDASVSSQKAYRYYDAGNLLLLPLPITWKLGILLNLQRCLDHVCVLRTKYNKKS